MILDEAQVNWITKEVNKKVNVPLLGEKAEGKLIRKAVELVLKKLDGALPEEVTNFMTDAADGIEPGADTSEMKDNTVDFLNKEINIPILNEKQEGDLISKIVDLLFDALEKGESVPS